MPSFESIFEFLFKYRPVVFDKGRLVFATPWPEWAMAALAAGALLVIGIAYARARTKRDRDRLVLGGLRLAVLVTLLFCLVRPTLVIPTVVPQRNFLGILIDDSRSMTIADREDVARSAFVERAFGPETGELLDPLAERFMLRLYRFGGRSEPLDAISELSYSDPSTDLSGALDRARRDLASVPLAGLVVVTDGADNASAGLTETLLALQADSVPVYPIGLGRERFDHDIEVTRVETPRSVLQGSSLAVDVVVNQRGYSGREVTLNVEDNGRIVASQEVELPGTGESATVRVSFEASETGPRLFRFHVPPLEDERVDRNNAQTALIEVRDRREKILYYEAEPRFEVKFIRRAVADDPNLQIVTLQETADNKFLRLDVDGPDELVGGFPKRREELFRYRALVLGSVPASKFTHGQLRMIEEFVAQRGGGLLMLGSRRSFAEGGYADTPLAGALPVILDRSPDDGAFFAEVSVSVTPFGETHPVTRIAETADSSVRRWSDLPPVSTVNRVFRVKPGASTLLTGSGEALDDPIIVLAHQRYGRGRALALPIQDTWLWQMHAEIPLDDMTHEVFWRQLLRWLVSYVPDPVQPTTAADRVAPGRPVEITAEVHDPAFLKVNNSSVVARVTSPSGAERPIDMQWKVDRDGVYRGSFVPDEKGIHEIRVEAREGGEFLGGGVTYTDVADLPTEYFGAEMRSDLLERIAEETGGRFYRPDEVAALPEDVSFTESGTTVIERRDLWDMPIVFLMLVVMVASEWVYRRRRGLL